MSRRKTAILYICGVLGLLLFAECPGSGSDVDVWEFLDGDLSRLAETAPAKSVMFSSVDRTGGNDDGFSGLFSRIRIDENGEHVLAEMDGPGCVKRIWMTWPGRSTRIRVYIDGKEAPALDLPIEEFFSGDREPFVAPFVGGDRQFGGISFSYVPIPFAKSIRITTVDGIRFYQINAHAYPKGSKVKSFAFPPRGSDRERLARALEGIAALPDTVTMEMPWTVAMREGDEVIEFADTLSDASRKRDAPLVLKIDRPGEIVEMRIGLEGDARAWRTTWLQAWWDDETWPSVALPLSDLFGSAFAPVRVRSAAMLASERRGVLRLPMPFRNARVELTNTRVGVEATVLVRVLFRPREVGEEETRLHATRAVWEAEGGDPSDAGVPFLSDVEHIVLRASGRGHYVGTLLSARGGATSSFLEGDETVIVDGDSSETMQGTGTEDYFNAGWYFAGRRANLPSSGISFKHEGWAPRVSAYRWHLSDGIAFEDSLEIRFEIGDGAIEPGTEYSTAAVWYQREPSGRMEPSGSTYGFMPKGVVYPRHMIGFADPKNASGRESDREALEMRGWHGQTFEWKGRPAPLTLNSGIAWYVPGESVPSSYPRSRAQAPLLVPPGGFPEGRYDVSLVYALGPGLGTIDASLVGRKLLDRVGCAADTLAPVVLGPAVRMNLGGEDLAVDFEIDPAPSTAADSEAVRSSCFAAPFSREFPGHPLGRRKLVGIVSGVLLTPVEPPIDRWLVAGPFEDWACTRFDSVDAPEREHEAGGIRPDAVYRGIGGAEVRWREARADSLGFVNLREAIGPGTHRIAYGAVWVFSPRARAALFSFGSDDGAQVWLNGERVHRWPVHRGWEDDQDRFTGELKAGWNEVLVKVEQRIAGWGFSLRLSDARSELVFSTRPESRGSLPGPAR